MSDAQKIQPFSFDDVPSGMEWCVYGRERKRGNVKCYPAAYKVVLALRWLLSYTDMLDYTGEYYESWRVHWKMDDEYGFKTRIFVTRDKIEDYDSQREEWYVRQEKAHRHIATLVCSDGNGVITGVSMPNFGPYESDEWLYIDALTGVERLLQDATYGSKATHSYHPATRFGNEVRVTCSAGGRAEHLRYSVQTQPSCFPSNRVIDLNLTVEKSAMRW